MSNIFQSLPRNKHFWEHSNSTLNIFNISAERSTLLKSMFLSAVLLNVAFFSGVHLEGSISSRNIQHIQHYSWKKRILENNPRTRSTYSTFQPKEAHFWKCVSFSCIVERCLFSEVHLEGSISSRNTQHIRHCSWKKHILEHIQHIQHFSRSSTFLKKYASHTCNVKYFLLGCTWKGLSVQKTFNIIKISNITAERSTSSGTIQEHNQHIQLFSQKKHIFCFVVPKKALFLPFRFPFSKKGLGTAEIDLLSINPQAWPQNLVWVHTKGLEHCLLLSRRLPCGSLQFWGPCLRLKTGGGRSELHPSTPSRTPGCVQKTGPVCCAT